MATQHLTAPILRSKLTYDQNTGYFYRKKETVPTGRLATKGYRQIFVGGARHMAHRLAWLYTYGDWPIKQLDHINRDKDDNRISNLRLADNKEQQENIEMWSHNRSGFRGVSLIKNGSFQADIKIDGKTRYLGTFSTLEEAATARMQAEKSNFSLGQYSPIYSRITHGEVVRVNNRSYSIVAPGTKTECIISN